MRNETEWILDIFEEAVEGNLSTAQIERMTRILQKAKELGKRKEDSHVHLHIMDRQRGGTFASIARAIQISFKAGRIVYIAVPNYGKVKSTFERLQEVLGGYHISFGMDYGKKEVELPNGSRIRVVHNHSNSFCGCAITNLIIDEVLLQSAKDGETMMENIECAFPVLYGMNYTHRLDTSVDVYLSYESLETSSAHGKGNLAGVEISEKDVCEKALEEDWVKVMVKRYGATIDLNRI